MAGRKAITIGGDGSTTWVETDGQRFNMGTVSVLGFTKALVGSLREAKRVMDSFNEHGKAVVAVDLDKMWDLFPYRRSRFAGDGSFMPPDQQTHPLETVPMNLDVLKPLEAQIAKLNKLASEGTEGTVDDFQELAKLAQGFDPASVLPGQAPQAQTTPAPEVSAPAATLDGLAYDTFQSNSDLATQVLAQAEETVDTIDKLAASGKKFDSGRAKADILHVTTKIAGIVKDVDLTQSWVKGDLDKLAGRMGEIHGLFAGAKTAKTA